MPFSFGVHTGPIIRRLVGSERKIIWLTGDRERLLDWRTPTRKRREIWFIRSKQVIDWRRAKEQQAQNHNSQTRDKTISIYTLRVSLLEPD